MGRQFLKLIVIVVGLYLVFVLGKSLIDLKKAGGRLSEAQTGLTEARQKNQELKLRLAEVNSAQFIEREAREKLNLQKLGEVVLIMPEQKDEMVTSGESGLKNTLNYEKWWKLFFE